MKLLCHEGRFCLEVGIAGTDVLERGQNLFVSLIDFSNCVIGQTGLGRWLKS